MAIINFLHTFHPAPILISLGPTNIYWYGFFIVLGVIAAISITLKLIDYYSESRINPVRNSGGALNPAGVILKCNSAAEQGGIISNGVKKENIIDLAFWIILGGLIGARFYHIILEFPYYLSRPLDIFKIWQGGLAIHGGIMAGIVVIWIFAKHTSRLEKGDKGGYLINASNPPHPPYQGGNQNNFWFLASIIAPGMALAQAIGRWGNYFNQELFGKPTNLPWGIPVDIANRPFEYFSFQYFHPTFLYESIGNFIIFSVLILIHVYLIRKIVMSYELRIMSYKLCVMCYLILYSVLRFLIEFIRIDRTPELVGLRWPQIASILIITASIIILLKNKKSYANIKNSFY